MKKILDWLIGDYVEEKVSEKMGVVEDILDDDDCPHPDDSIVNHSTFSEKKKICTQCGKEWTLLNEENKNEKL